MNSLVSRMVDDVPQNAFLFANGMQKYHHIRTAWTLELDEGMRERITQNNNLVVCLITSP